MEYRFPDEDRPGKLGRILKGVALLLIAAVFALLLFRMCTDGAGGEMKDFLITEPISALPSPLSAFSQELPNDLDEAVTDSGNRFPFQVSYLQYAPDIGQLQLTVRYNKSLEKALLQEYSLSRLPEGEWFVFALEDQNRIFYTEYVYLSDTRNVNCFRRLVFSGIDFSAVRSLTLCVYPLCAGDVTLSKPLFDLPVYEASRESEAFTVSLPAPVTEGLAARPAYTVTQEPQ